MASDYTFCIVKLFLHIANAFTELSDRMEYLNFKLVLSIIDEDKHRNARRY